MRLSNAYSYAITRAFPEECRMQLPNSQIMESQPAHTWNLLGIHLSMSLYRGAPVPLLKKRKNRQKRDNSLSSTIEKLVFQNNVCQGLYG